MAAALTHEQRRLLVDLLTVALVQARAVALAAGADPAELAHAVARRHATIAATLPHDRPVHERA